MDWSLILNQGFLIALITSRGYTGHPGAACCAR